MLEKKLSRRERGSVCHQLTTTNLHALVASGGAAAAGGEEGCRGLGPFGSSSEGRPQRQLNLSTGDEKGKPKGGAGRLKVIRRALSFDRGTKRKEEQEAGAVLSGRLAPPEARAPGTP